MKPVCAQGKTEYTKEEKTRTQEKGRTISKSNNSDCLVYAWSIPLEPQSKRIYDPKKNTSNQQQHCIKVVVVVVGPVWLMR